MLQVNNAAQAKEMTLVTIPEPILKNKWRSGTPRSSIAKFSQLIAPKPKELRFYPELPACGSVIWGLWSSGAYGYATYVAAWTFRTPTTYFNELPILAWHPV